MMEYLASVWQCQCNPSRGSVTTNWALPSLEPPPSRLQTPPLLHRPPPTLHTGHITSGDTGLGHQLEI